MVKVLNIIGQLWVVGGGGFVVYTDYKTPGRTARDRACDLREEDGNANSFRWRVNIFQLWTTSCTLRQWLRNMTSNSWCLRPSAASQVSTSVISAQISFYNSLYQDFKSNAWCRKLYIIFMTTDFSPRL